MPKKLFRFPVRRPDTITRANIRGLLVVYGPLSPEKIAGLLTRPGLTPEARHVRRAASLS